jgi:hypothetical protein
MILDRHPKSGASLGKSEYLERGSSMPYYA